MAPSVTIFVTTPRSGTQWVADAIGTAYPNEVTATHEAIGYAYAPRRFIRAYDRASEMAAIPEVRAHLDEIHALPDDHAYVEVGFPAYASIPLYVQEFGERLRIVQLVRHPALVAASMVTHRWYDAAPRPELEDVELTPADAVFQRHYAARWDRLSQYEKCLFFWSEVHLLGWEYEHRYPEVPFHRVRFRDLIEEPQTHLRALTDFIGLPYVESIVARVDDHVDRFSRQSSTRIETGQVRRHRLAVALAERFGYEDAAVDEGAARDRYYSRWRIGPDVVRRARHFVRSHVGS